MGIFRYANVYPYAIQLVSTALHEYGIRLSPIGITWKMSKKLLKLRMNAVTAVKVMVDIEGNA